MNEFISYLNSIHNVGGDSTGSLAEKQVTSPFFDMVKIDRKLGTYISDCVEEKRHRAFILTGHAGDGKTSILVQVLKALNLLAPGEKLKIQHEYEDFYYVKDMSEIPEGEQANILAKALKAPLNNKSSLLISNTGPLLRACTQFAKDERHNAGTTFLDDDQTMLHTKLLTQLDENLDAAIEIEGYEVILVNIARVDNVFFSSRLLKNLLEENLWTSCTGCPKEGSCPIKSNRDCLAKYLDRVSAFVENFYRYLYENDKRMTIRQMIGQLSFALTGNLTCETIIDKSLKDPLFNYNFANLFFGYYGLTERKDYLQIKGVRQIHMLNLDSIALDVDYDLFVKRDYKAFPIELQTEIDNLYKRHRKLYQVPDEGHISLQREQTDTNIRKAIRRIYLVFSVYSDPDELFHLFNQIFGPSYSDYKKLISEKQSRPMLRKMRDFVFKALYIKNTGFLPDNQNDLYLSLRREDDVFQSVMLILGKVNKDDLDIIQVPTTNDFEDHSGKYQIALRLKNTQFIISLPMITYFSDLISGAISSNNNPALTHGVAKLDALLIEQYGENLPQDKEDCELTVLINTSRGQEVKRFGFEDSRLSIL